MRRFLILLPWCSTLALAGRPDGGAAPQVRSATLPFNGTTVRLRLSRAVNPSHHRRNVGNVRDLAGNVMAQQNNIPVTP